MDSSNGMTFQSSVPSSSGSSYDFFTSKNTLITILVVLLIFSLLGINLLGIIGQLAINIIKVVTPLITNILAFFGYTTGVVIDRSADLVGDTAKTGIGLVQGAVGEVGEIIQNTSSSRVNPELKQNIDNLLNVSPKGGPMYKEPQPSTSESPIQKPIKSNIDWCLVGEYQGKRGCIAITEYDKCLSGQVFPTQAMCLNPTRTNEMR
jgi:hypothetical protein